MHHVCGKLFAYFHHRLFLQRMRFIAVRDREIKNYIYGKKMSSFSLFWLKENFILPFAARRKRHA